MKKWVLSRAMAVLMVISLLPLSVFAEEGEGCRHVHDESCGYEVAVSCGCTDTDGDGVIDHQEGCGYVPGAACSHQHDETCGGLPASQQQNQPDPHTCICESKCDKNTIFSDCPVCDADFSACTGEDYGISLLLSGTIQNGAYVSYCQSDDVVTTVDVQGGNYGATGYKKTTYNNAGYQIKTDGFSTASVTAHPSFINDGRYVKLSYTVTNNTAAKISGNLGVHADVQIGADDYAVISVIFNKSGKAIGLKMVEENTNAQFNLYFAGTGGVTDADTYWIGRYDQRKDNCFNSTTLTSYGGTPEGDNPNRDGDSGLAISWIVDVPAGESKTYSFIVGVGEAAAPPEWSDTAPVALTMTAEAQRNELKLIVTAKVKDADGVTDTLYYSVDGGVETQLGNTVTGDGSTEKEITGVIDLTGTPDGTYKYLFWIVNSKGVASEAVECTIILQNGTGYLLKENGTQEQIHTHSWEYSVDSASKNVLIATCSNSLCQYNSGVRLTLSASSGDYTGTPYNACFDDGGTAWTNIGLTLPPVQYTDSQNNSVAAPMNAGSYKATVTVDGKTAEKTFTITPIQVDKPAENTTVFTYNGLEQTYTLAESTYYTITGNKRTDAGEQTVTVSLKDKTNTTWSDNTTADVTFPFTVGKADPTYTAPVGKEQERTGSALELVNAGSVTGGTMEYSLNNRDWSTAVPTASAVGTYTVYYRVTGDANHNDVAAQSVNAKITLATLVGITATGYSDAYDGQPHGISVNTGSYTDVSITYGTSEDNCDKSSLTYTDAGTYTVYYQVSKTDYANYIGSATVRIDPATVTVSGIKADSKTYDGTTNATLVYSDVTLTGKVGSDDLTVTASGTFESKNAGNNKMVNITGLTLYGNSAGNYTLAASGNQETAEASISPKPVTVTITPNGGTYGGTITRATAVLNDLISGDTPTVTLTYSGNANNGTAVSGTTAPTLAGSYTVTASISDRNYTLTGTTTAQFVVAKATVEPPTVASKVYKGTLQTASISATNRYSVTTNAGGTNAGRYDVVLCLSDSANYKWADSENAEKTVPFEITKAALTITANDHTITYGDAPAGNGVTYSGFVNSETESVLGGTLGYAFSYSQFGNVGSSYTITPNGLTSDNYSIRFVNGTLTVGQKEIGIQWGETVLIYTGAKQVPAASATGTVNNDEIALTVTGGETDANTDANTSYSAEVTAITGDKAGNYKLPDSGLTITFTIKNASQTAPDPNTLTLTNESIKGKEDGIITIPSDTPAVEYRKAGDSAYRAISGREAANLPAGIYYVRYAARTNYDASPDTPTVEIEEGRMLTITLPSAVEQVGYTLTSNATECEWHGGAVLTLVLAEEYSRQTDFAVEATNAQVADNGDGTFTISNAEDDVVVKVVGVADRVAPTASIAIKEDKWTRFWNNLTFKLFFNDTVKVTITAADQGSGVDSISYHLSATELTEEGIAASTIVWTAYPEGGFSINAVDAQKNIVYAKVTDHAGNTLYLNSDGMTMDKTAPVTDLENGKTYYNNDKAFTLSETNLESVTLDGKPLTPDKDGKYHIPADNQAHKIVVTDKAGNEATYTVTVCQVHTVTYLKARDEMVAAAQVNHGGALGELPSLEQAKAEGYQPPKGWFVDGDPAKAAKTGMVINADTTIQALYESKLYTGDDTKASQNTGGAKLMESDEKLIRAALTEEEQRRVENGEDVRIWLETEERAASDIPSGDKTAIDSKRGVYTVGMYLDVSIFKQVGSDEPRRLTNLSNKVTVTLTLPDRLLNVPDGYYRTYKVIRVHDGIAEQIDAKVNKSAKTLTFETDRFSTYAVTYKDTKSIIPQTGDNSGIWMATFTVTLAALVVLAVIRKKQTYKPKYKK